MYGVDVHHHVAYICMYTKKKMMQQYVTGRRMLVMSLLLVYKVNIGQAKHCSVGQAQTGPHVIVQHTGAT